MNGRDANDFAIRISIKDFKDKKRMMRIYFGAHRKTKSSNNNNNRLPTTRFKQLNGGQDFTL